MLIMLHVQVCRLVEREATIGCRAPQPGKRLFMSQHWAETTKTLPPHAKLVPDWEKTSPSRQRPTAAAAPVAERSFLETCTCV